MANLCLNELHVTGPEELVEKFKNKYFSKEVIYFNDIIPEPNKEENIPSWRNYYWGTRSDGAEVDITNYQKGLLHVEFQTAWTPCCPIIKELIKQYPKLDFYFIYYEPQMRFAGKIEYSSNKKDIKEQDYGSNDHRYLEFLREEGLECFDIVDETVEKINDFIKKYHINFNHDIKRKTYFLLYGKKKIFIDSIEDLIDEIQSHLKSCSEKKAFENIYSDAEDWAYLIDIREIEVKEVNASNEYK